GFPASGGKDPARTRRAPGYAETGARASVHWRSGTACAAQRLMTCSTPPMGIPGKMDCATIVRNKMLIEDPGVFSLVIPTWQGTPFLRRCLDYLKAERYAGHLLLSDDSSGEHRAFVASCPERYPELRIELHCYEPGTRFLVKLARSLEKIKARYAMLCGQDDFIVLQGVEKTLLALRADPALACARGRVARFHVNRAADGRAESVKFMHHNMRAYREPTAVERVLAHLRAYTSTLYSVHRREDLIDSFQRTERATQNVIFYQYLSSCIVAARGQVAVVEDMFLVRQAHDGSWASNLRGNYEHWPLLITSPHYAIYYQEFRSALLELL